MRSPWLKPVVMLTAAAAFVTGLILAGRGARNWLDRRGHYDIALADVECPVPPGLERAAFLAEVQYLGSLPDRISAVNPSEILRLTAAFAAHPWVEQVEGVSLGASNGPQVRLRLRTPVLAVQGRAVDRNGVLLPAHASVADLIEFRDPAPTPKGPAGAPWGDAVIENAAKIAALLVPFQAQLRLSAATKEADEYFFTGGTTLRWGSAGDTEVKLDRLRLYLEGLDCAIPTAIDLTR